jgi:hypothetical protein
VASVSPVAPGFGGDRVCIHHEGTKGTKVHVENPQHLLLFFVYLRVPSCLRGESTPR